MNIIISLFVGTLIGFIAAAFIAVGKMADLDNAIYEINQKINVVVDLITGEENDFVKKLANEIKDITEGFYNGN